MVDQGIHSNEQVFDEIIKHGTRYDVTWDKDRGRLPRLYMILTKMFMDTVISLITQKNEELDEKNKDLDEKNKELEAREQELKLVASEPSAQNPGLQEQAYNNGFHAPAL